MTHNKKSTWGGDKTESNGKFPKNRKSCSVSADDSSQEEERDSENNELFNGCTRILSIAFW